MILRPVLGRIRCAGWTGGLVTSGSSLATLRVEEETGRLQAALREVGEVAGQGRGRCANTFLGSS